MFIILFLIYRVITEKAKNVQFLFVIFVIDLIYFRGWVLYFIDQAKYEKTRS